MASDLDIRPRLRIVPSGKCACGYEGPLVWLAICELPLAFAACPRCYEVETTKALNRLTRRKRKAVTRTTATIAAGGRGNGRTNQRRRNRRRD